VGVKLQIKKPFFNSEDTYNDVEKMIREKNIIVSRDQAPIENANIEFYKDGTLIIDKNTHLSSANIAIRLVSDGKNKFIVGASKVLNYKIPYFNVNLNIAKNNKFANYDNKITGY